MKPRQMAMEPRRMDAEPKADGRGTQRGWTRNPRRMDVEPKADGHKGRHCCWEGRTESRCDGSSSQETCPQQKCEVPAQPAEARRAVKRPRAALSKVQSPAAEQGSVNTEIQRPLSRCQARSSHDKGRFVLHPPPPPSTWETSAVPSPRRTTKLSNSELQAFKVSLLLEPRHISSASQD